MARLRRAVWLLSSCALALVIAGAHSVAPAAQGRSATFPVPVLQIGQTSAIWSVDVTPSGRYLVTTSGHDVAIWHREKGWLLRTLTGHRSEVHAVAFSQDGTLVASGTDDGELALWRVADGRRMWNKTQTDSHISAVRFTRDGSIMTASWDNTIRLWNEAGCAASCVIAKTTESPASLALSLTSDGSPRVIRRTA